MTKGDIHFDLTKNDDWFDIKLLIHWKKGCDKKHCIKDKTYLKEIKIVFNRLNIFNNNFVHVGLGIGPIKTEIKNGTSVYQ